jgi:hypothetical protein
MVLVLVGLVSEFTLGNGVPGVGTTHRAAAQPPFAPHQSTTPQVDGSVPARQVTMIGATPEEPGALGANETWGIGTLGKQHVLVRYYQHSGGAGEEGTWTLGPALQNFAGQPLTGFEPAQSPLVGEMTATGAGVLVGTVVGEGAKSHQVLLVRKPGGAFQETANVPVEGEKLAPGEEPLLNGQEAMFAATRLPLMAPLEEKLGQATQEVGALIAPVNESREGALEHQVLHWNGSKWSREPIEVPTRSSQNFRVLALAATSPTNAWLLGQLAQSSYPTGSVALFRRVEETPEHWSWKPVALAAGPGDGEAHPLSVPVQGGEPKPFTVSGLEEPPTIKAQLLTVTSQGVWVDGRRSDVREAEEASTTLFFKPEGTAGGTMQASWCKPSPEGKPSCSYELPETLPDGYGRSFAWTNSSEPFGERVITGLREGVSLRLEGDSFTRVLALGAGHTAAEDPGGEFGAAFSSPTEGWLGQVLLPVHVTEKPVASRLTPWPTPFRTPLLAIAPQPGAPVGSLTSEALAVGLNGEVARYKPGQGWQPESLFGPGGSVERQVQLRAVAWPRPTRAYAVGNAGQMWLWRGETGLWEPDPAIPLNFRANMLGVAFDPNNPARGYAIGTSEVGVGGVLLRYGKTWTEETNLPAQVQGAAFTSITFAGSEAIVAYRKQPNPQIRAFVGGLLVNNGSGWRIDEEAAAAIASGVPRSVAGLPDGAAALLTEGEVNQVIERESENSPWQATPVPPPGDGGSLSLFREGGVLRAILAGGSSGNLNAEPPPPAGFPPFESNPIGTANVGPETAVVLRQTASGWSDETHELDPITQPFGGYRAEWDMPYRPDPIQAVLVDPTGSEGWAVGGIISGRQSLETADIERYPADGVKPAGAGEEAKVPLRSSDVTLAVAGHAECIDPCAGRARAGVGPQVWLASAFALARKIGVSAFLYTGPSVSEAPVEGPQRTIPLPFQQELARNAEILEPGTSSTSAYVAASPQDRDARPEGEGSEQLFEKAFAHLPSPFGEGKLSPGISVAPDGQPLGERRQGCAAEVGCQAAYYAMNVEGAPGEKVRVIMLDDSSDVDSAQLQWLEGELINAKTSGMPAIVVGSADLNAQIAAGDEQAANVAAVLIVDGASAYFYDSPEENVEKPLRSQGQEIPSFGSGTLGYVSVVKEEKQDFHGASGVLLAQVEMAGYKPAANNNRAPVSARLIPVIGELALEGKQGTLLRRSKPALFAGLARRPRAGGIAINNSNESQVDPYIPIPEECVGRECAVGLFPEFTFRSSRTDVGQFVKRNTASGEALAVLQGPGGKPIPDEPKPGEPTSEESGLFCAYNAGTTIVTIEAGGLSASLPVTVQAGSVREPCGTVPLKELPPGPEQALTVPPPTPAPAPAASVAPASAPPPLPLPPPPPVIPPHLRQPPKPARPVFFTPAALGSSVLAFVPPPVPTPARPTPPSGTSAVTSPIEVAEHEEEEEEATESVSNQAVAYRTTENEPSPAYILGIIILAAFAGASIRRRSRWGRAEVRVAPATISTMRAQRRISGGRRPR